MQSFILFDQIHLFTLVLTFGVIALAIFWIKSQSTERIQSLHSDYAFENGEQVPFSKPE